MTNMKETVWLLRDRKRPGRYMLARRCDPRPAAKIAEGDDIEIIPWRVARKIMNPEAFYELCHLSFSDWTASNL